MFPLGLSGQHTQPIMFLTHRGKTSYIEHSLLLMGKSNFSNFNDVHEVGNDVKNYLGTKAIKNMELLGQIHPLIQ